MEWDTNIENLTVNNITIAPGWTWITPSVLEATNSPVDWYVAKKAAWQDKFTWEDVGGSTIIWSGQTVPVVLWEAITHWDNQWAIVFWNEDTSWVSGWVDLIKIWDITWHNSHKMRLANVKFSLIKEHFLTILDQNH